MVEQQHREFADAKQARDEDWWAQCWHSDRIDTIGWAAAFIWGGLVLLAGTTNFSANYAWWDGWSVFFTGLGVIVLLGTAVRLVIPRYRQSVVWGLIFGFILLGIGLDDLIGLSSFWALALLIIGFVILMSAFSRRR